MADKPSEALYAEADAVQRRAILAQEKMEAARDAMSPNGLSRESDRQRARTVYNQAHTEYLSATTELTGLTRRARQAEERERHARTVAEEEARNKREGDEQWSRDARARAERMEAEGKDRREKTIATRRAQVDSRKAVMDYGLRAFEVPEDPETGLPDGPDYRRVVELADAAANGTISVETALAEIRRVKAERKPEPYEPTPEERGVEKGVERFYVGEGERAARLALPEGERVARAKEEYEEWKRGAGGYVDKAAKDAEMARIAASWGL